MKTRSDSELSKKNGGIIRPRGFFFETFWANSPGRFGGLETFFKKKIVFSFISFCLHLVSSLVLLLLSSCLVSSLLSIFSSLVFHLLSSCLVFSFVVFHLLSSCLVFSFLVLCCLSFSLSLSLCVSVSLCLCLRVVLCVVVLCGVCGFKNASVCAFKTSPCADTTRTCVSTCARGARTHRDVLNLHTKGVLYIHTGEQGVIVSSASQNLPTYGCHVLQSFTKETFGSFPFSSLRTDLRTTCPRFLQSFALLDKAVQFTCTPSRRISCDTCA